MNDEPKYTNECYQCGCEWLSWYDDESCPECGEYGDIGTDAV